jgi:hypothetical protein
MYTYTAFGKYQKIEPFTETTYTTEPQDRKYDDENETEENFTEPQDRKYDDENETEENFTEPQDRKYYDNNEN